MKTYIKQFLRKDDFENEKFVYLTFKDILFLPKLINVNEVNMTIETELLECPLKKYLLKNDIPIDLYSQLYKIFDKFCDVGIFDIVEHISSSKIKEHIYVDERYNVNEEGHIKIIDFNIYDHLNASEEQKRINKENLKRTFAFLNIRNDKSFYEVESELKLAGIDFDKIDRFLSQYK